MFWQRKKLNAPLPVSSGGFSLGNDDKVPAPAGVRLTREEARVANTDSNLDGHAVKGEVVKGRKLGITPRFANSNSSRPTYILPIGYRITSGTLFIGGEVRIDGEFAGRGLVANKVQVNPTGRLRAPTEAREAIVDGLVSTTLKIKELLTIRAGGEIRGHIEAGSLRVEDGAIVTDTSCIIDKVT